MIHVHARLWAVPHPTFLLCVTQRLLCHRRWWMAYVCSVLMLPLACRYGQVLENMRAQWMGALAATNLISGTRVYRRLGQVLREDLTLQVLRRRLSPAHTAATHHEDLCALLRASFTRQPEATHQLLHELAPALTDARLVGRLIRMLIERDAADILARLPMLPQAIPQDRRRELLEHCAHLASWRSLEVLYGRLSGTPQLARAVLAILVMRNCAGHLESWLPRACLPPWEYRELEKLARVHGSWETSILLEALAPLASTVTPTRLTLQ